jgi:hypothetical protein
VWPAVEASAAERLAETGLLSPNEAVKRLQELAGRKQ